MCILLYCVFPYPLLTFYYSLYLLYAQNAVIVEALKNIAGISYFPDYYDYTDLNLRKHQALHCPQTSTGLLTQQRSDNIQSSSSNQEGEEGGKDVVGVEEKSETAVESSMKEEEGNTVE